MAGACHLLHSAAVVSTNRPGRCLGALLCGLLLALVAQAAPFPGSAVRQARADYTVAGTPVVQRAGYDYAPTMIQSGNRQDVWWCGQVFPTPPFRSSDAIWHRAVDVITGRVLVAPEVALRISQSGWDSWAVCDPSVVEGVFDLDGQTWTYAMYYTATDCAANQGTNNRIGLALSHDGRTWTRYSRNPVIGPAVPMTCGSASYGVGNAATYNGDGRSHLYVFHTDTTITANGRSTVQVRSTGDGVTFSGPVTVSNRFADSNIGPGWSLYADVDVAMYARPGDPQDGHLYAVVMHPGRFAEEPPFQYGIFEMPGGLAVTGQGEWTMVGVVDTNLDGQTINRAPSFDRDIWGNLDPGQLPDQIQTLSSVGRDPIDTWDIASVTLRPHTGTRLPFRRYLSRTTGYHQVTTGFVDPSFTVFESTVGYLFQTPQHPAARPTRPLYGCVVNGSADHMISPDPSCEGQYRLGINGWIYANDPGDGSGHPIYRCYAGAGGHFVSALPGCEGAVTEQLLGWALDAG
jgi:hypothetical protein